jgi:hypothetical protein
LRPEPSGGSVRCSADGSLFRSDGAVLEGPAKTPISRFEVRSAGNGVEVRSIAATA